MDPHSMLPRALDAVKPAAAAKNIRLQLEMDPSQIEIQGDPGRLQQVMWNLINNAIKFTPRDGTITIRLSRVESSVEIKVTDTGEGIGPELLPHVFNRFQQGDASSTRKHGGLGLGLAIVKHLVEMHGGTVAASSLGLGFGATFTVTLPTASVSPIYPQPEGVLKQSKVSDVGDPKKSNLSGLSILVVDDEADGRALLRRILTEADMRVATAENVTEALEKIDRDQPDLLISDIGMPILDGYDLIRTIRGREITPEQLPAIALTAFARTEDRRRAMLAGYQMHLAKPVDLHELIAAIMSLTPSRS
jgi:CheY-like chemotaxis protein